MTKRITALLVAFSATTGAATNETYTVTVPDVQWKQTNVIKVIRDHEKKVPPCTLIRYVENGKTNDFHTWAVEVIVKTNKASRK